MNYRILRSRIRWTVGFNCLSTCRRRAFFSVGSAQAKKGFAFIVVAIVL